MKYAELQPSVSNSHHPIHPHGPTSSSTSSTPPQRASVITGLGISNPTSACVVNISAATSSSTGAVECRRILRARAGSRSTNLAGGTRTEAAQAGGGR
jgi:hypothetical protein